MNWGLLAEFASAAELVEAARRVHEAGYRQAQAYAPFHVDGLAPALGFDRDCVPAWTFAGGVVGGLGGFFLQWFTAVHDYPVNIGGRPLDSWPMFIPVTFELAVLGAALAAFVAMLAANRLPRLAHPLFALPAFELATRNRFFLALPASDPGFDGEAARQLLEGLRPIACLEVPE
jgi:hypothetical protein